ncbi:hypothetical protein [Streptomyces monashensis]|nr:hypothetical protein [Streptomyces monashensis]
MVTIVSTLTSHGDIDAVPSANDRRTAHASARSGRYAVEVNA